ncbi:thiamine pyrophosphate-dependent enzyme [Nitratidesulfovibrio liaohensis]|uniref:Thiamine pyrophosphate-dependent enzyme n=1 Tax=Nitratidesulfovibrio liaohensis TaxID=2604158 RepID=A0ABY9R1C9_9BACT|nr:thiamine pyrophosphate-dependent enzyme [Nitratidesulfovibrio liaohensis]WMW65555.1 thiamine pyrophosphate-dependent enzyme [Nitratidesulfovibrio liaohensis]
MDGALGRNVVYRRGFVADEAPVTPDDIAVLLNDFYDGVTVGQGAGTATVAEPEPLPWPLACDIGDCLFTALSVRPVPMVGPGYYASMGFGVPAGMGLQMTTGQRSLTLVGDGAFQMTGMELGNCARLGIDPVVMVFNNASWEMLRVFQPETSYSAINTLDFAAFADALGGRGHRVTTRRELASAFAAATTERGRFQLIDVRLEKGAISDTLANFVAGVKRVSGVK